MARSGPEGAVAKSDPGWEPGGRELRSGPVRIFATAQLLGPIRPRGPQYRNFVVRPCRSSDAASAGSTLCSVGVAISPQSGMGGRLRPRPGIHGFVLRNPNCGYERLTSYVYESWVAGGSRAEVFRPGFRPNPTAGTRLDRRGQPRTSICTKRQPRRPILRPRGDARKVPPDCLQVPRTRCSVRVSGSCLYKLFTITEEHKAAVQR